eukprot:EST41953.1 Transmembrane domain-containing protein [Spironucleus salmonicida]
MLIIVLQGIYDDLIMMDNLLYSKLLDQYDFTDWKTTSQQDPKLSTQKQKIQDSISILAQSVKQLEKDVHKKQQDNGQDYSKLKWRYPKGYEHELNKMYTHSLNIQPELTSLTDHFDFVEFSSIVDQMTLTSDFLNEKNFVRKNFAVNDENILIIIDGGNKKIHQILRKVEIFIGTISRYAKIQIVALGRQKLIITNWTQVYQFDINIIYEQDYSQFVNMQMREIMQFGNEQFQIFRSNYLDINMKENSFSKRQKFVGFTFTSQIEIQLVIFDFPMTLFLLDEENQPPLSKLTAFRNVQYIFDKQSMILLTPEIYFSEKRNYFLNFGDALPVIQFVSQELINYICIYQGIGSLYPDYNQYQIFKQDDMLYYSMPLYIDSDKFGRILLGIVTVGKQQEKEIISQNIILVYQGDAFLYHPDIKQFFLTHGFIQNILYQIQEEQGQIIVALENHLVYINWTSLYQSYKILSIQTEQDLFNIQQHLIDINFINTFQFIDIINIFEQQYCLYHQDTETSILISVNFTNSEQKCSDLIQNTTIQQNIQNIYSVQDLSVPKQQQFFFFNEYLFICSNFQFTQDYINQFNMVSLNDIKAGKASDTILSFRITDDKTKIFYLCQQFIQQLQLTALIQLYQIVLFIELDLPDIFRQDGVYYLIRYDFKDYYTNNISPEIKSTILNFQIILDYHNFIKDSNIVTNLSLFQLQIPSFCSGVLIFKNIFNYWFVIEQNFKCIDLLPLNTLAKPFVKNKTIKISFFQDQQYFYSYGKSFFNQTYSYLCENDDCYNHGQQQKLNQLQVEEPFKSVFKKYYDHNQYNFQQVVNISFFTIFLLLLILPYFFIH